MSSSTSKSVDNSALETFDLERYLGRWYEIARYDHKFESDLVGVSAYYSLRSDGKIEVLNSGYKYHLNGEYSQVKGKAKVPNPQKPAELKVAFFLFFYADYFVMEIDEDYQWAVVGSRSDKFLWILARRPMLSPELYAHILTRIEKRGYDSSKLILVEQKTTLPDN